MSRLRSAAAVVRRALPTGESVLLAVGFFGGLAAVAGGVALVSVPAGVIIAGVLSALTAGLYARNGGAR